MSEHPDYMDLGPDEPEREDRELDETDPDGIPVVQGVPVPPGGTMGPPPGHGLPPRPRWQRWLIRLGIWCGVIIGAIVFSTIVSDLVGVNFFVIMVPLILVAFGARFYYNGMRQVQRSRYIDPSAPQPLIENLWVDQGEFEQRVLPYLGLAEHEKRLQEPLKVEIVTRRHWMLLVRHIWLPALVSLIVLILVAKVGLGKYWPGLFLILPAAIWDYFRWLYWRHSYFVATNFRVYLIQSIPAFWWWLESPNQNIPLQHVLTVNKSDTSLGNRYGYGGVQMDSAAEHDEPFRHITFVPLHKRVVDIINATIDARTARSGNVSSP